jgi:hypothetical protein
MRSNWTFPICVMAAQEVSLSDFLGRQREYGRHLANLAWEAGHPANHAGN